MGKNSDGLRQRLAGGDNDNKEAVMTEGAAEDKEVEEHDTWFQILTQVCPYSMM